MYMIHLMMRRLILAVKNRHHNTHARVPRGPPLAPQNPPTPPQEPQSISTKKAYK